jgi:hypothetical protein
MDPPAPPPPRPPPPVFLRVKRSRDAVPVPALLLDDSLKRSRLDSLIHGLSFKDSAQSSATSSAPKLFQRIDAASLQHCHVVKGSDLLQLMAARAQNVHSSSSAFAGGGGGSNVAGGGGGDRSSSFISVGAAALDLSAECQLDSSCCVEDTTLDITGGIAAGDVSGLSRGAGRGERKARRLDASFKVCDV